MHNNSNANSRLCTQSLDLKREGEDEDTIEVGKPFHAQTV